MCVRYTSNLMWVESIVHVGDHQIQLCVEQLQAPELERTAAVMAWLSLETLLRGTPTELAAWYDMVAETVGHHVTFVMAEDLVPSELGGRWWDEAVATAFIQFIRDNELAPRINRHLETLRTVDNAQSLSS